MKLGILGGGQLAQMLAIAADKLDVQTRCLDPNPDACSQTVTALLSADFTDKSALDDFLLDLDCVTFETENIPLESAEMVLGKKPFFPSLKALETTQDRLHEKTFFQSLDVPTPTFAAVSSEEELKKAAKEIGLPAILKTRRFGYDGKGQAFLKKPSDIDQVWDKRKSLSLILEGFVHFDYEVSLIAVRSQTGETAFYPLTKNKHVDGILRISEAPFVSPTLQAEAEAHARKILDELEYVGVLAIEFFFDGEKLIANEMAPRVHNSGHWTIEGAQTSQFENHVRAVCGLLLGNTDAVGHICMFNMIGETVDPAACESIPGAHYHDYGKEPRPGRKLGHITLVDTDTTRFEESKMELLNFF